MQRDTLLQSQRSRLVVQLLHRLLARFLAHVLYPGPHVLALRETTVARPQLVLPIETLLHDDTRVGLHVSLHAGLASPGEVTKRANVGNFGLSPLPLGRCLWGLCTLGRLWGLCTLGRLLGGIDHGF